MANRKIISIYHLDCKKSILESLGFDEDDLEEIQENMVLNSSTSKIHKSSEVSQMQPEIDL